MTKPPLAEKQIWLPGGDPSSKDQREIKSLDDATVTYIIQSDKGRSLERSETIQRFLLWILQSKSQEISVVYSGLDSDTQVLNG
jgi:hypothetical protein